MKQKQVYGETTKKKETAVNLQRRNIAVAV